MPERRKTVLREVLAESQSLGTYDMGETIEGLARKLGKEPSEILKLNSNENFFVPLDFLRSALREVAKEVDPRIYPRDELGELKEALVRYVNVSPEHIVIGTGSDQLIDLVTRMVLEPGDEALSIAPTFSIYERCVRIQRALYRSVPLRGDFSLDTERILGSVTPKTKLLFICSPNNPTANQFSRGDIELLADQFDGLVAVDEAYVDFSNGSLVDLVNDVGNLIIFRTFSKVFGLAGLRLGCAIANPELTKVIDERYQMPYTVTITAVKVALKLLDKIGTIEKSIREMKSERNRLTERLNMLIGVHAFKSETNFVLVQLERNSDEVYKALLEKGVIVRNLGTVLHLDNCLRVTVAPRPMMAKFSAALKGALIDVA